MGNRSIISAMETDVQLTDVQNIVLKPWYYMT